MPTPDSPVSNSSDPRAIPWRRLALGGGTPLLLGLVVLALRGQPLPPPPAAIAQDRILVRGYEIYSTRCLSCHGPSARGDGPIARGLAGPAARNLVENSWKHGETPKAVVAVLANGVKDSAMPAFGGTYDASDLKATAAYLYQITGRSIPAILREP